jgi:hypothetical protein
VVDDSVAERGAGHGAGFERGDRLAQRRREAIGIGLVGIAVERRRRLELVLDPMEPCGDHGGEREIRIDVSARDPRLDAARRTVTDEPEPARPVVVAPGERRRCPAPGGVALVRIDRRREEDRELGEAGDHPREEAVEELGVVGERRRAVTEQGRVDVTRVPDPRLERLGHERDRAAVRVCDLLRAVLVDRVVVRHGERVREAEVDLVLAGPCLALRGLDPDPGGMHAVADLPDQILVVRGREDVVVEDVRDGRRQILVALRPRLLVALAQEIELELRARHRREAERGRALHLCPQHLARRRLHGRTVVPEDVRENERGALEPRDPAQRREIRLHREVAVAPLPAGDLVPRDRIHLHVECEQVVAALDRAVVGDLVAEELAVEALSHEPSLHVRECDDDGVDLSRPDLGAQLVDAQHRRSLRPDLADACAE